MKTIPRVSTYALGVSLLIAGAAAGSPLRSHTFPGNNGLLATSPGGGVYVVPTTGASPRFVTGGASPSWSPDGRRLVFFRSLPGACAPCFWELVVVDLRRRTTTKVVEGSGFDPAPAWSPDGTRIAYSATPLGVNHIFSVNLDGGDVRQLTFQRDAFNPSWSPDGTRVAYNAFAAQGVQIFSVGADGSDVRQLTPTGSTFNVRPDWSPDGARIAYGSDRDGSWELWTMNPDGSDARRLTSGGPPTTCASSCFLLQVSPSWAPDGTAIAYVPSQPGEGVAIVAADGSGKRLVPGTTGTRAARWQSGVSLSVRASPTRLPATRVGKAATARVTVTNAGRRDATRVQVRVSVTSGRGRIAAGGPGVRCSGSRVVVCTSARLAAGAAIPIQLRLMPSTPGRLAVQVAVEALEADVDERNDVSGLAVTVRR